MYLLENNSLARQCCIMSVGHPVYNRDPTYMLSALNLSYSKVKHIMQRIIFYRAL